VRLKSTDFRPEGILFATLRTSFERTEQIRSDRSDKDYLLRKRQRTEMPPDTTTIELSK
jgi:hypothetical protein